MTLTRSVETKQPREVEGNQGNGKLTGIAAAAADSPGSHNWERGNGHSLVVADHNWAVVVDSHVAVLVLESRTLRTMLRRDEGDSKKGGEPTS